MQLAVTAKLSQLVSGGDKLISREGLESQPCRGYLRVILFFESHSYTVPPAGIEPAARSLGNCCSIRLSYGGNAQKTTISKNYYLMSPLSKRLIQKATRLRMK